jgi:hypothetical protein
VVIPVTEATGGAAALLEELERMKSQYGGQAAKRKLALLQGLENRRLARAPEVLRFHEVLCFLRGYPDNPVVLSQVERLLVDFDGRADLRRHRRALINSGIAGTAIHFSFFWFTARWLARRWPERLSIEWAQFRNKGKLVGILPLLVPYSETPALDELTLSAREWVRRFKGPGESDAVFLVRLFEGLRAGSFEQEKFYEDLQIPIRVAPGPDTPSRTRAKYATPPVVFQRRALSSERPDLHRELRRPPLAVRPLSPRDAQRLIDLAREAMVTRSRDLDVFEHADRDDVRLVDGGDGLQFACIGVLPERRLVLEAVYGFLTLKNGIPIGYALASALFGSSEVMYNVFETYRGAESASTYGRLLAMVRHLFGSDSFTIDPYQLGTGNPEALESGAWWFYYKLGFRPHDPGVRRVLRAELARLRKNPRHHSSLASLRKLAARNMFFYLRGPRSDILGGFSPGNVGLRIARRDAERFGSDREAGVRICAREAARLLGLRTRAGFSPGQRLWWERWSPLIMALPGVEHWTAAEKRALIRVVRAKGGRRESDFVSLFDGHRRLRQAVLRLADL